MQATRECLIIDDDQDDQEIFLMCVRKISKDINCMAMDDGINALSMLASKPQYIPDYIFVDVNMPKMNGIDCLRALKGIDRLKDTKIFMYSTTSETSTLNESKRLGANDFIVKPPKTETLKEKLSTIFEIVSKINIQHPR
ncbi:MAG TPA: response regulator [Mucilaginibacter sp.]|jgi:CheY-like chemotaxis protein|nr:response regulator [Mucilaginibacter sp.]